MSLRRLRDDRRFRSHFNRYFEPRRSTFNDLSKYDRFVSSARIQSILIERYVFLYFAKKKNKGRRKGTQGRRKERENFATLFDPMEDANERDKVDVKINVICKLVVHFNSFLITAERRKQLFSR